MTAVILVVVGGDRVDVLVDVGVVDRGVAIPGLIDSFCSRRPRGSDRSWGFLTLQEICLRYRGEIFASNKYSRKLDDTDEIFSFLGDDWDVAVMV